ncbi:GntR family transcriptional regulator [Falsiroseomonas oryzae]|uniref:GntR family transcriptional regulator n=1 Tax=Falsiroseomonas oryzae TaxID=2766473 RepID=UPI0022EA2807|nr:GntR family transcriptional regulator [Roseomonas sp. MO-31]
MNDTAQTALVQIPEIIAAQVARHLEEQIVFGELAPNTRLVEEDIVRRYGVSRSPVREALRLLEQEGLAVRETRRGASVSAIGLRDLDEIYACRLNLEGLAAEEAAKKRADADVVLLRAELDALVAAGEAGEVRAYFRHNVAMTDRIHAMSGNGTLRRLLGSIGKAALRYRYLVYHRAPEMIRVSVDGNRAIVEAIAQQNARSARAMTEDLLLKSWDVIRRHLAEMEAEAPAESAG